MPLLFDTLISPIFILLSFLSLKSFCKKVQEVCVIGILDISAGGETIKSLVVLKPEYRGKLTEKELIDWCKEKLASYKYPRIVEFRNELPKSAAGKYLRRVLRDEELGKMGLKK